jgi:phospholipid/cholesterol/gamma-HCH transport system substrate-binding protein
MKKYSLETTIGIFVLICLLCVAYLTLKLGEVSFLGDSSYPVFAKFTSVSGLKGAVRWRCWACRSAG